MTVGAFTDSANRLTFTADSSTVSYSFNFEIADKNSIEVYVDNVLKSIFDEFKLNVQHYFNGGASYHCVVVVFMIGHIEPTFNNVYRNDSHGK